VKLCDRSLRTLQSKKMSGVIVVVTKVFGYCCRDSEEVCDISGSRKVLVY